MKGQSHYAYCWSWSCIWIALVTFSSSPRFVAGGNAKNAENPRAKGEYGRPKMPYWRFFGLTEQQYHGQEGEKWRADVDMHRLITPDDPPIFAMTSGPERAPSTAGIYNHHPYHAQLVEQACQAQGVEVVCLVPQVRKTDAKLLDENPQVMMDFLFTHLGLAKPAK